MVRVGDDLVERLEARAVYDWHHLESAYLH
jgi:hypothetical protein